MIQFFPCRCNQKKTRDLWWQGLPPSVRGRVWILAIGNELNITANLYNICLARARDHLQTFDNEADSLDKSIVLKRSTSTNTKYQNKIFDETNQESSMNVIQLDISRTFPNLGIFQEGGL